MEGGSEKNGNSYSVKVFSVPFIIISLLLMVHSTILANEITDEEVRLYVDTIHGVADVSLEHITQTLGYKPWSSKSVTFLEAFKAIIAAEKVIYHLKDENYKYAILVSSEYAVDLAIHKSLAGTVLSMPYAVGLMSAVITRYTLLKFIYNINDKLLQKQIYCYFASREMGYDYIDLKNLANSDDTCFGVKVCVFKNGWLYQVDTEYCGFGYGGQMPSIYNPDEVYELIDATYIAYNRIWSFKKNIADFERLFTEKLKEVEESSDSNKTLDSKTPDKVEKRTYISAPISTAYILDNSGSMASDNKIGCARLGVEGAIRALSEGDYASVSHFSTSANTPPGLESKPVLDQVTATNTDNKDSALSKINPGGGTCIGKGLKEGLLQLDSTSQPLHKAAVLLSDGEDTCGGNGQQQINEQDDIYSKKHIPITTIKYGKEANEENLRNIATKTGGSYAEGNCGNIPATFFRLGSEIALKALLLAASEVMKPDGTIIYNIFVEGESRNLGIFADWQGSKLRITLHSPTGEIYSREDFLNKGGRFTEGKRYQFAELQNPTPGNWQVELTWDEPPHTAEQVNTTVVSNTDIFSSILGFKPQYSIGDKVLINVAANEIGNGFQKHTLQGAKVTARVQIPGPEIIRMIHAQSRNMRVSKDLVQDNTLNVQLFDDGAHGDFKAGDGIWGGYFSKTQKKGPYIVTASIEGRTRNGTGVKRKSVSAFQVGSLLDADVTPSQVLQYNQKQLAKLKSKINNPLGTMQESFMNATQSNPAPKSKKKKRSRSLMDKISN